MSVKILAVKTYVPGGDSGLLEDLLKGNFRGNKIEDPTKPKVVSAGSWRKMSRLTRIMVAASLPLIELAENPKELPIIWGSSIGELEPTFRFLDRLFKEGPTHVSPMNFQNSVYNAPSGHLSSTADIRGISETISAGGATGLMALSRGIDLINLGKAKQVLVVAGDTLTPDLEKSFTMCGLKVPAGESVTALLLEAAEKGNIKISFTPIGGEPVFSRKIAFPGERSFIPIEGAFYVEEIMGLSPVTSLTALSALFNAGENGLIVDIDGPRKVWAVFSG